MQPPTNPHREISKSAATLLAAATQAAMLLVQQRRKLLQEAANRSQETANRIKQLQDQQLQAAKPIFKQAGQTGFWDQDLTNIANTYETCKTWEAIDEDAHAAALSIEKGLDERYPHWRENRPPTNTVQQTAELELFMDPQKPTTAHKWTLTTSSGHIYTGTLAQNSPLHITDFANRQELDRITTQIRSQSGQKITNTSNTHKYRQLTDSYHWEVNLIEQAPTVHAPIATRDATRQWGIGQLADGHSPRQIQAHQLGKQAHPHSPTKAISPAVIAALAFTAGTTNSTTTTPTTTVELTQ